MRRQWFYFTNKYKSSNSSNYKPSSVSTKAPSQPNTTSLGKSSDKNNTKPAIISLNMTIPNMDDLLDK